MRRWAAVVVGLAIAFGACGSSTPSTSNGYAIVDVTVVDVETGVAVPSQTVVVAEHRIEQIAETGRIDIAADTRRIDGQGLYLIPGLVDAHAHFFDAPVFGRVMIANGVLVLRNMAMLTEQAVTLQGELDRGEILGPEMVVTGAILDGDPPIFPDVSVTVRTPEEGRVAVRQQVDAGVDMIKVYSRLDAEAFMAILDEAQSLGIKVVGHVPESVYIADAAAAGLSSSEHLFGFEKVIAALLGEPIDPTYRGIGADAVYLLRLDEIDRQDLQQVFQGLRDNGLTVCPTVITFRTGTRLEAIRAGDFRGSEYISQTVLDIWSDQWEEQSQLPEAFWQAWAQMVQQLHEAGVPLLVGTDLIAPGVIPGFDVHEEMGIWQDVGIPAPDVLRSATIVPAQFMGLDDRLGTIAEGKAASMVLVRANPLEDIRNAQQIEGVFLRGQYFSRGDLDQLLEEARDLAGQSNP